MLLKTLYILIFTAGPALVRANACQDDAPDDSFYCSSRPCGGAGSAVYRCTVDGYAAFIQDCGENPCEQTLNDAHCVVRMIRKRCQELLLTLEYRLDSIARTGVTWK